MGVDMIWTGDDVGMQTGMLISPALWRRHLKPRMAELIARVKAINPSVKVAYHSDGMIWDIIPDLIEIGLDVLNPVQPACMDPGRAEAPVRRPTVLLGLASTSSTRCPSARPRTSAREVRTRLSTIGRNGGLILGPTHHVQLDTPMENFWAMVETVQGRPFDGPAGVGPRR